MTVRRRSRTRPLTEFASRSALHALAVWRVRSAVIAVMFLAMYLLIANILVPMLVDGTLQQMTTP